MFAFSDAQSTALVDLGRALQAAQYKFVTITPASHERVLARGHTRARNLRDVFGWSLAFEPELLPAEMLRALERAQALEQRENLLHALVRFSTLGRQLFVHSAFPTTGEDAVFFGPDTYRFCDFIRRHVAAPSGSVVDVGCGTGAGGLALASCSPPRRLILSEINPRALALARVNAELAGIPVELVQSDVLRQVAGEHDVIIANPPYMQDQAARTYRHGGGAYGEELSVRIVRECLPRLAAGGTFLLYTGAPIVDGEDVFYQHVRPLLEANARVAQVQYEQVDVDVFGEELVIPAYARVERIAAVGLSVRVSGG